MLKLKKLQLKILKEEGYYTHETEDRKWEADPLFKRRKLEFQRIPLFHIKSEWKKNDRY